MAGYAVRAVYLAVFNWLESEPSVGAVVQDVQHNPQLSQHNKLWLNKGYLS